MPVLGVFYGTSLIADEVEDKTITYLFTRPIPRGAVLVGKYLAYLACTVFVVLPSVVLVWLLIVPMGGSLGRELPGPRSRTSACWRSGLAVYGAVFALTGRRAEAAAAVGPGLRPRLGATRRGASRVSEAVVGGLLPPGPGAARDADDSPLSLIQELFREVPPL